MLNVIRSAESFLQIANAEPVSVTTQLIANLCYFTSAPAVYIHSLSLICNLYLFSYLFFSKWVHRYCIESRVQFKKKKRNLVRAPVSSVFDWYHCFVFIDFVVVVVVVVLVSGHQALPMTMFLCKRAHLYRPD